MVEQEHPTFIRRYKHPLVCHHTAAADLLFFTTTVIMLRLKKEKTRKVLRNVSIIIFLCFLVCGILSVAIPYSDVAAEMGAASTYNK